MKFRATDTLLGSLAKLIGGAQEAVKTAVFEHRQLNPTSQRMGFHKLNKATPKMKI